MKDLARVRRVSRVMRVLCTVAIVVLPAGLALMWLFFDTVRDGWPTISGVLNLPPKLPVAERIAGFAITMIPAGLFIYGLFRLRALFGLYARGEVFHPAAARCLRGFAWALVLVGASNPLTSALLSVALTLGNPPGERTLAISLSSDDLGTIFLGGLLLVIAWIMGEAGRIAEENRQFV